MRVEVYNESEPKPEPEKVLRLRLISEYGSVRLVAVDEAGATVSSGNLLQFRSDGGVTRFPGVNPGLGLKLDDRRIAL